jgi:hypothetical protein
MEAFLDSDCNFVRAKQPFAVVPAALLGQTYIALDIARAVQSKSSTFPLVVRVVFNIYALPFCSISNIAVLIAKWRALSEHVFVKSVKLTVALLIFAGFAIYVATFFTPVIVSAIGPFAGTGKVVTDRPVSSVCRVAVENWSMVEFAGIAAAAQSVRYPDVSAAILATALADRNWTQASELDNQNIPVLVVSSANGTVVGFQGIAAPYHLGVLLETVLCYWYPLLMGLLVPFFAIVNQLFLAPILNAYSMELANRALGLVPVSTAFFGGARDVVAKIASPSPPLFTGHMSGALFRRLSPLTGELRCCFRGTGVSVLLHGRVCHWK